MPTPSAPPPPTNYYSYDQNGNVETVQVWDASKNAYITKVNPKPTAGANDISWDKVDPGVKSKIDYLNKEIPSWQAEVARTQADSRRGDWQVKQQKVNDLTTERDNLYAKVQENPDALNPEFKTQLDTWQKNYDAHTADTAARAEIRSKMLANLNQTPEDRLKAYDQYAQSFSDVMHRDVDKRYQDIVRSSEENLSARGMMGSRAYADTMGRLAGDKTAQDTDIANQATMAKEQLASNDRGYYLNVLNSLDAGARADSMTALEKANSANNAAISGNAVNMANYNLMTSGRLTQWQNEVNKNQQMADTSLNTATGLAYLYGYKNPGGGITPPGEGSKVPFSTKDYANFHFTK